MDQLDPIIVVPRASGGRLGSVVSTDLGQDSVLPENIDETEKIEKAPPPPPPGIQLNEDLVDIITEDEEEEEDDDEDATGTQRTFAIVVEKSPPGNSFGQDS